MCGVLSNGGGQVACVISGGMVWKGGPSVYGVWKGGWYQGRILCGEGSENWVQSLHREGMNRSQLRWGQWEGAGGVGRLQPGQ